MNEQSQIIVREAKGEKDRATMLPANLVEPLKEQIAFVRKIHERDVAQGCQNNDDLHLRVAHSSEVLAPGRPNQRIQFIDARDLAEWTILLIELEKYGIYNEIGPNDTISMMEFLDSCDRMCHGETKFTWISEKFLLDEKIEPWTNIPLWVPEINKGNAGFFAFDNTKAIKDGLTFRQIDNIVYDTYTWAEAHPSDHIWRAGIDRAKQTQLLEKWYNMREKNINC